MRLRPTSFLALLAVVALPLFAQTPEARARSASGRVSGFVHDSIAHAPLAGAWVQLVDASSAVPNARTTVSDSAGRYAFDEVPDGRYQLGFFHAVLDSLGVEVPPHDVVIRGRAVRADLAIPSGATLGALICGERTGKDSGVVVFGATVVGVVRDAVRRTPADGALVAGEWFEIVIRPGLTGARRPRLQVTTGADGWFALCDVPVGGTIFLQASRGPDSTDVVEAEVPTSGFLRRDLWIGPSRVVVAKPVGADSLAAPMRRLRVGDGRLTGIVLTVEGDRALREAQAHLTDGPSARADERGAWAIANAPRGSRMLEIRAVGYYPVRRAVDVIDGAAPVRASLRRFSAVLDTVRIVASVGPDRQLSGFAERRRTGLGRYYTAVDLERRGVIETSDLFKNVPGVFLQRGDLGTEIFMRSAFAVGGLATGGDVSFLCRPAVYVDAMQLFEATADEIDLAVPVRRVRAVEVYTEATVPPQFQRGMTGCGAILFWTR